MEYSIILRTVIFYLVLIVIVRLLGKREVGEISVFDLVILLILADIATIAINAGWDMVLPSILSLISLLILQKVIAYISLKFVKVRKVLDYSPSVIMFEGRLNIKEMIRQAYTIEDFLFQARETGVMDLSEIQMAILEPTGQLSVFVKETYKKEVLPVVISGAIQKYNLDLLNLKEEDLKVYLEKELLMLSDIHYLSSDGKKYFIIDTL